MEFALNIEKSRQSGEFCSGGHFLRNRVVRTYFFPGTDLPGLLCIILPWVERIRPRIVIVRAITCVRNQVLNIKHIGSTNVAGKFKPAGVRIDLLNDLHRTNLSSSELVVVTSRKSILRKDSPNKTANFKLHVPSPSVSNSFDTN